MNRDVYDQALDELDEAIRLIERVARAFDMYQLHPDGMTWDQAITARCRMIPLQVAMARLDGAVTYQTATALKRGQRDD